MATCLDYSKEFRNGFAEAERFAGMEADAGSFLLELFGVPIWLVDE